MRGEFLVLRDRLANRGSCSSVLSRMLTLRFCLAMISLAAVPAALGQAAPKPLGRLVPAGDHRLHLNCTGKGSPTIVFENGTGDFSFIWSLVQPQVSRFARACSYDRAGYAWSDPGPLPRTFQQINLELHTALHNAGIAAPYVLVGQSYGGFVVRSYIDNYKSEVAGVVLVDSAHENERVMIQGKALRIRDLAKGTSLPGPRLDLTADEKRQYAELKLKPANPADPIEPPLNKLSPEDQKLQVWASSLPGLPVAQGSELDSSQEEIAKWYAEKKISTNSLGDIPLVVITRAEGGYSDTPEVSAGELERDRREEQQELVRLSRNGKQVTAEHSGHNIHIEDPDLVTREIREVVTAARKRAALR